MAALAFAEKGTTLAAAGERRAPEGSSPLLILTNDRSFTIAASASAGSLEDSQRRPALAGLVSTLSSYAKFRGKFCFSHHIGMEDEDSARAYAAFHK